MSDRKALLFFFGIPGVLYGIAWAFQVHPAFSFCLGMGAGTSMLVPFFSPRRSTSPTRDIDEGRKGE